MDLEEKITDLLSDKRPISARDLMLAWSEQRNATWADAAREAETRCASDGHLPQIRGQLRYHLGQKSLVEAARSASVGVIPLRTTPAGGTFIVARVGRFALVSLTVQHQRLMPRRSITRLMLSQANEGLDPQQYLFGEETPRGITELAYFGCLTAIPNKRDPSTPSQLALAVPNKDLTGWLSWTPLHRLHGLLQQRVDAGTATEASNDAADIQDIAFPKFRVPSGKKDAGDDGNSG